MTIVIAILSVIVGIEALLQGWQMLKKKNNNPGNLYEKLDGISSQLKDISSQLKLMSRRIDDIWERNNK